MFSVLSYLNNNKERKFARKIKKKYGDRVEQIFGDVANYSDCESLVKDADYVVNLAMGIWQGIYLCEFRNRGGGRKIVATIIG